MTARNFLDRITEALSDREIYRAARNSGQILYGRGRKPGTHGSNFSFSSKFEVRRVSRQQAEQEMADNESYELYTFDPFTSKPLWNDSDAADPFVAASDGNIYIADQNWGTAENGYSRKTIIYVIGAE